MAVYYIAHHGIKGQKWGVKNGPPYPLAPSDHSAAEKRQGSSRNGARQKGDATLFLAYSSAIVATRVTAMTIRRGKMELDKMLYRKNNATERQISIDWASERDQIAYLSDRAGERELAKRVTKESDLKKKDSPGTPIEDMKAVNPNYKKDPKCSHNCMYCAAAFDLRRRGYDVHARPRDSGGHDSEIAEWYNGAKTTAYNTAKEVLDAAKSQPDGSRGILSGLGPWGGHELAYEINNRKLTIYDAQSGNTWSEGKYKKFYAQGTLTRLDNIEPNWKGIGEVISDDSIQKRKDR